MKTCFNPSVTAQAPIQAALCTRGVAAVPVVGAGRRGGAAVRSWHGKSLSGLLSAGLLLTTLWVATAVAAQPPSGKTQGPSGPRLEMVGGRPAAANQVIVRYRDGAGKADRDYVEATAWASKARGVGGSGNRMYVIEADGNKSVAALVKELSAQPSVLYAEPNYYVQALVTPNDPLFGQLWGLDNTGQTINGQAGTFGADIDAVAAWNVTTGTSSVVVGVVDTGVDYNRPDLAANIWSAPSAFTVNIAGQSLTCPAGSHGIRSTTGFGPLSCDPMDDMTVVHCAPPSPCFYGKHGTHVAGTIGAKGDNSTGVVGVNWTTRIMGLKFLNYAGGGYIEDAINAIEFAIQVKQQGLANVRVLNNSWGGGGFSQALLDQMNKANANDILFVAAAGNSNTNNDTTPVMPGGINAANSVNVAATDNRDGKASFSNYGPTTVHLGAPGVGILSTVGNGGQEYFAYNGTSMASPHVAGAAALILAGCPGLDTAGLKATLLDNVDSVASMAGITITGGRLNVNSAVSACAGPFYVTASPAFRSIGRSKSTTFAVTVANSGSFSDTVTLSATGLPSGTTASFSPSSIPGGSGSSTMTVTTGAATPLGTYAVTIKGTSGATVSTTTVSLEVANPDFSIAAGPASVLVNPGTSAGYSLSLGAKGSFASPVSFSVSGLPAGAGGTLSPASLTPPGSASLTVATSSTTPDGVYPLTVTATGGGLTHSAIVNLEVRKPTFVFNVSQASVTVKRGFAALLLMDVTGQYGFNGTVSISVSGLCSGCTASVPAPFTITPSQPWSGAKSSVVRTSSTTPVGTYTLTYTATGAGVTKTDTVALTVNP